MDQATSPDSPTELVNATIAAIKQDDHSLLSGPLEVPPRVNPAKAWYVIALLCVIYSLSMLDRMILALLVQPICTDLHLSYTQLGMLIGLSFGLLYAIIGLPLAHVIDRGNRIRWLFSGVLLWSLMTVACAFARTFSELALSRAGVAVGEAVLAPAAMSLIGDLFPREKRAAPTVVYMGISTVMASGAFVLGGWTFKVASTLETQFGLSAWRLTLILVGLPGVLLSALVIFTVREPARTDILNAKSYTSVRDAWAFVVGERKLYGFVFIGVAAFNITGAAFGAWTPTLLIRKFDMTTSEAGYLFGAFGAGMGLLGTILWPWLITRFMRGGNPEALLTAMAYTLGGAAAAAALLGLITPLSLAALAIGLFYFLATTTTFLPPFIIQSAAPGEMRGRLMAGNLLASNMIGAGVGPGAAAAIAENIFQGTGALGSAFVVLAAITGPVAFASFLLARRSYGTASRLAAAREATSAKSNTTSPERSLK